MAETKHTEATSREDWTKARLALLEREKAHMRSGDELAAARRALPRLRITKDYRFSTRSGERTLGELFAGRSQLLVYHFMLAPDWKAGCKSCSFWTDHFQNVGPHLAARDVTFLTISRAPLAKLQAFAERMGWTHEWVSSHGSDFNFDFGVSFDPDQEEIRYNYATAKGGGAERPGISAFLRDDDGAVFHTYSTYGRGIEVVNATYHFLDLAPKGRNEAELDYPQAWVKLRDEYGAK